MNGSPPISVPTITANAFDMFLPRQFSVLNLFLKSMNLDASAIVTIGLSILAFGTWLTWVWNHVYNQISTWFASSIIIDAGDELFERVLSWLSEQNVTAESRTLVAKSRNTSGSNLSDPNSSPAELALRYELSLGQHYFFHKGRPFLFQRDLKQNLGSRGETIRLTCVGRSTQPIKDLVMEAQLRHLQKEESMTAIRRPSPKYHRSSGRHWSRITTRPSRPMDTVVLDHDQKAAVISDVEEYLLPTTAKWYASRGIPYRRGYLFHGPSGAGKTSFATALAGAFGIDIFVISLLEPSLTEEDLITLFNELPQQCIVLLEDIDSAGLTRKPALKSENDSTGSSGDSTKNKAISLSGLLNAIDGVASHEGRVLLMTTNHPEKLDEALLRPGRIDMQVKFSKATRSQARELFMRMYACNDTQRDSKPKEKTADGGSSEEATHLGDLEDIARKFAESVPECEFSPAEIQGFLLTKKNDPKIALAEVQEWTNTLMIAKGKVVTLANE